MGIYGPDLSRIHAEAYSDTFRDAFPWLVEQIRAACSDPSLLDAGCGSGAWLGFAKDAGIKAQGVDISRDFVDMCVSDGLAVRCADLNTVDLPKGLTAVTALGEVLAYRPAALCPFASEVARALEPGGVFLFDLTSPGCVGHAVRSAGEGWTLTADIEVDGAILTRTITTDVGGHVRTERHQQVLFEPKDVVSLLSELGFHVEIMPSYGPVALLPGRFAVKAIRV